MQRLADVWAPVMLTVVWQAALLAALVLACEWVLRVTQARVRHRLWWLVLVAPLVLAPARLALEGRAATVIVPAPQPVARAVEFTQSLARPAGPPSAPLTLRGGGQASRPAVRRPTTSRRFEMPASATLMAAWVVGCAIVAGRLLLGHRWLRRLIAASRPVHDANALRLLEALCAEAGVPQEVALRISEDLPAPLLYGLRRPMILMPREWLDSLSPGDLRVVLAHEVAHIKRRDVLGNLLQRLAELPLFFHPAAWLAGRRIMLAREELCDAAALAKEADPRSYALSLLAAAERARGQLAVASVGVAEGKFTLLRRVEAIMRRGSSKRLNRAVAVVLALVVLAAAALLAAAEVSGGLAGKAEPKAMFSACTPGHPAGPGLFVADSDLSNPVRLTTPRTDLPNAEVDSPGTASGCDIGAWSPDGTRAVVSRTMYLYLLHLEALIEYPGQEPIPLTDPSGEHLGGGNPSWSPDGTRIVYHNEDGVVVVDADGSGYRVIAPVGVRAREPEWSPDGSSIAFRCGPEGYAHLYLATNINGPGDPQVRQLYDDPEWQECWPHWSPDSTTLAFTRVPAGDIAQHGDIWLLDVASGQEVLLTDTPEADEQALGWSPFDGQLYYMELAPEPGGADHLVRMQVDGTEVERLEREVRPAGRLTWAMVGTWIEGVYALPGERVAAKLGLQDADEVAEAIADVGYPDTLEALDVTRGASIRDWTLFEPQTDGDTLSAHAYAGSPEDQAVTGPSHLFDLHFGNTPLSGPDDLALLTFEDLYLGDRLGRPVTGPALAGGVRTIQFAALELSITSTSRHPNGDIGLWVTVRALDRSGQVMVGVNGDVRLGTYRFAPEEYWETQNKVWSVDPEIATLRRGVWSGKVVVPAPRPGARLLAYWGDIAAYSDPLVPEQQTRHEGSMVAGSGASSGGGGGGRAETRYTWLAEPTRSEAVQALSNMKQIALALQMFVLDHDDRLPSTTDTSELMEVLRDYVKDQSVFLRPGTNEPAVQFTFEPGKRYDPMRVPAEKRLAVVDYHPEWRVEAYLDGHVKLWPKGAAEERARSGGGRGVVAATVDFMPEARQVQKNMQRLGLAMRSYLLEHAGIFPKADSVDEMLRRLGPYLAPESILVHATISDPLDVRYLARSGAAVSPDNAAEPPFAEATCAALPGLRVVAYADGHAESRLSGEGGSGGGGWALTAVLVNMEHLALAMRAYLADHNNRFPAAADGRSLVAALETYLDPRLLFTRPGTKDEVVVRYVMKPGTTWSSIPGREAHTVPVFVVDYSPEFTVMVDAQMIATIRGKD